MLHNHHGTMQHPISIMKKRVVSNPIEQQRRSSGAVKVDLSSADKTIRRPGSEPDLKTSPMRSSMRTNTPSSSNDIKRLSGVSQGSSKKVMFSGVASDHDDEDSNDQDNVWVLRQAEPVHPADPFKPAFDIKDDEDDVPVTGVVIAQPQPCKFALAQAQFMAQQQVQQQQVKVSPNKKVKATPPPPPPRTTPVNPANAGPAASASANGGNQQNMAVRPANPVLQRPAAQQFHESPDEGYHEDDNGSEIL